MLSAEFRLRRQHDIARVVRHGRVFQAGPVRAYYLLEKGGAKRRIACVVGKKVSRQAVVRHRYQRWLRELAAQFLAADERNVGYDMVWVGSAALQRYHSLADFRIAVWPKLHTLLTHS